MAIPLRSPRFTDAATGPRFQKAAQDQPTIKRNESNRQAVRVLQQALIDAGFPLPESVKKYNSPDGLFGDETDGAVRAFQAKHFPLQTPDGKVGKNTLSKLDDLLPFAGAPLPPLTDISDADFDELGRQAILEVLCGAHCARVSFVLGSQEINFGWFWLVKQLVEANRIRALYDPIVGDTGLAVYNPNNSAGTSANCVVVPKVRLVTWKQRSVLVHECVHAIQDIRRVPMSRLESEKAAYIAQNMYHRLATGGRVVDTDPRANAIHIEADRFGQQFLTNQQATFTAAETTRFENALRGAGYGAESVPFDGVP